MKRGLVKLWGKKKFKQHYGKTIFFIPYTVEVIFDLVYSRIPEGEDPDFNEDSELMLDERCPNCGVTYDDIDFDYQICHLCKFNNDNNNRKI